MPLIFGFDFNISGSYRVYYTPFFEQRIWVSAPTINWHIGHLKEEGIVRADANGRHTEYSIDPLFVGQFKNSSDNENHQSGYNNYK